MKTLKESQKYFDHVGRDNKLKDNAINSVSSYRETLPHKTTRELEKLDYLLTQYELKKDIFSAN